MNTDSNTPKGLRISAQGRTAGGKGAAVLPWVTSTRNKIPSPREARAGRGLGRGAQHAARTMRTIRNQSPPANRIRLQNFRCYLAERTIGPFAHIRIGVVERVNQRRDGRCSPISEALQRPHCVSSNQGRGVLKTIRKGGYGKVRLRTPLPENQCGYLCNPRVSVCHRPDNSRHKRASTCTHFPLPLREIYRRLSGHAPTSPEAGQNRKRLICENCRQRGQSDLAESSQRKSSATRSHRSTAMHQFDQLRRCGTRGRPEHGKTCSSKFRTNFHAAQEQLQCTWAAQEPSPDCSLEKPISQNRPLISDPFQQERDCVCADLGYGNNGFAQLWRILPSIPTLAAIADAQPLTQLLPLILRLPLPRPNHEGNQARHNEPSQNQNDPSPFHAITLPN